MGVGEKWNPEPYIGKYQQKHRFSLGSDGFPTSEGGPESANNGILANFVLNHLKNEH